MAARVGGIAGASKHAMMSWLLSNMEAPIIRRESRSGPSMACFERYEKDEDGKRERSGVLCQALWLS